MEKRRSCLDRKFIQHLQRLDIIQLQILSRAEEEAIPGCKRRQWVKTGHPIRDSILILWNEGAMIPNQPAAISMANHSHSGIVDTLTLWDSNGNPINGTITATVDLGSNPVQGEGFEVEGDIGGTAITIPQGDYRLLGRGKY